MGLLKQIIKKYFRNLTYFYRYIGIRIFIMVGLSLAVSILDGFGLSMFLPLLQMVSSSGNIDSEKMGNFNFLVEGAQKLGIPFTLTSVLVFMVVFFLFKGIASFMNQVYTVVLQQNFVKTIRLRLLNALNQINFKTFITSDAGRIQNTMSGEVDRVAQAYLTYFGAFQQGIMVAVYLSFAFFVDVQFAVLVSIGGFITNFLYRLIYKYTKGASRKLTGSNHIYQGLVIQHVGNFKYLRATGTVKKHSEKLKDVIHQIENARKRIGVLAGIGTASREPLLIMVVACVILIQTKILGGNMGAVLISLLFFYRALASLVNMQQSWNSFMSVSGSLENMQTFQSELQAGKEKTGNEPFESFRERIELKNLSFNYGKTAVLKEINLNIYKNQSIAFVGESGSGKTTIVNLIAGLLPEDKGFIFVDGKPFRSYNKKMFQHRIGYITQEPVIFNDTIFNNVSFWAPPTSDNLKRFEKAIEQAALTEFVYNLPDKIQTQLGNSGINLSGGQKQRISIARELFKDIDILIMDEATSALDSETEKAIQESIESLKGKYTLLIVAHRLSTVRNVDRVIYMQNGCIADEGSFSLLLEKLPKFKKMVKLQEL